MAASSRDLRQHIGSASARRLGSQRALADVFGPTLRPGEMVGVDPLRAHNAVGVQPALARRGARLVYGPPSAPACSALEPG